MDSGGTEAAIVHGNRDTSNSVMGRTPLRPRLTLSQNTSRPVPNGDTTPIPEIATHGAALEDIPL